MKGDVQDIESIATGNNDFRRVLYTARNCQLVVVSLKPQEDIGAEVHKLDCSTAAQDEGLRDLHRLGVLGRADRLTARRRGGPAVPRTFSSRSSPPEGQGGPTTIRARVSAQTGHQQKSGWLSF